MKKYLREYYQDDEDFTYLEGLDTHFSELQGIMKLAKENDLPVTEQLSLQKVTFRLMYEKTYHRRLRLMKSAITDSYSLEKIVEAANKMEEISQKSTEPITDDDFDEIVGDSNNISFTPVGIAKEFIVSLLLGKGNSPISLV